jgi:hypothetical protein
MILRSSTSSSVLLVCIVSGGLSVFNFIVGSARAAVKLFILISHHPGALLQWFGRRSAITLQHHPTPPFADKNAAARTKWAMHRSCFELCGSPVVTA